MFGKDGRFLGILAGYLCALRPPTAAPSLIQSSILTLLLSLRATRFLSLCAVEGDRSGVSREVHWSGTHYVIMTSSSPEVPLSRRTAPKHVSVRVF